MSENLKCYREVRGAVGFPVNVSLPSEAGAMKEADIATWSSAMVVLQPFSAREYCPFCSSGIAYSEYITGRQRERERILKCVQQRQLSRPSGFRDPLIEIT
jgi:hypothetical protein